MPDVARLHREAMKLAERGFEVRRHGSAQNADELFASALAREREAAEVADEQRLEPTRSILFRSAAWLAYHAGQEREALRLVGRGLTTTTPEDIANELRELRTIIRVREQLVPEQPLLPKYYELVLDVMRRLGFEERLIDALVPANHPNRRLVEHPLLREQMIAAVRSQLLPSIALFLSRPNTRVPASVFRRAPVASRRPAVRPELSRLFRELVVAVSVAKPENVDRRQLRRAANNATILTVELVSRNIPSLAQVVAMPKRGLTSR